MRWQDLPEVQRIETAAFPDDAWSPASFWGELAARPRRDYVVLHPILGEVLHAHHAFLGKFCPPEPLMGYAGLDLAGETADVMTIAVDPAHRGEGHGVHLLEALLDRAEAAGASQVMLEVRADNEAAIGLYSRYGFAELHRRRGYYQPGSVDALIMRREVGHRD
nr:ribosomal protein S18-alanine N-acetyltransferase [Ornithinimicrobium sp. F0845]